MKKGTKKKNDVGDPARPPDVVTVLHSGTVLSYRATLTNEGRSLKIYYQSGTTRQPQTIKIQGKSPAEMFCPSVEGTVIVCLLRSGQWHFYDALSGKSLTVRQVHHRSTKGEVHFYA